MNWIDCLFAFLFWTLTLLLAHRMGMIKQRELAKKSKGKVIRSLIALLIPLATTSCESLKPAVMDYLGDVILVQECKVCVSYNNVEESDNSKSFGCFAHYDGHSYKVGDKYPQESKHSTGVPVKCGIENQ